MADEIKTTETTVTDNQQTQATTEQKAPDVDYKAEYERLLAEQKKLKDATDKACTEAANYKKALREKQTETERAEAERAEREAAQQAELEKLRTESRVNSYTHKLIESGYDAATAASMAEKLPAGIGDDFFAAQKAFLESQKKTVEADLLNKQPGLTSGTTPSIADYDSMSDEEYYKAIRSKK